MATGDRVQLVGYSDITGTLLFVGMDVATVQWDNGHVCNQWLHALVCVP